MLNELINEIKEVGLEENTEKSKVMKINTMDREISADTDVES